MGTTCHVDSCTVCLRVRRGELAMAASYDEDMGRKARWFREIHGSDDRE